MVDDEADARVRGDESGRRRPAWIPLQVMTGGAAASLAGAWVLTVVLAAVAPVSVSAFDRGADGEFEKRTSSHFVLFQDVDIDETSGFHGSRRFENGVLEVLEAAYDRLDQFLGLRPRRPITVVIYDPAIFDQQFLGLFRFSAAGFYSGKIHIRGDTEVHTPLIRVLHHELVHAAFHAEVPSLPLPAWFNEGVAEWFGARAVGQRQLSHRQAQYLRQVGLEGRLFTLSDLGSSSFSHLAPAPAHQAYLQSHAFIGYLARLYGERSLRELCRDFVRKQDLARAFRRTYRMDLDRLQADFAADLRGRSGG